MEGLIPDGIVDRVRSATDIVELISESVTLKRSGANYMGLCPFHTEKTPSFTVSPGKQIFHCFGCGAGGDAVGFLMKHENYTFPEAVRRLAERAGIAIPETRATSGRDKGEYEALLKANEEAAKFFVHGLYDTREGEKAREYLKNRGMAEAGREFGLGYSMPEWDGLLKHLDKKGVGAKLAEKAGLALPRQTGQGHYDRFRDRVMFPIRDFRGRVIGFGGRTMGDETPKYLNSPETPLFKKGETLYLLDVAQEHIRKRGYSVIVEGYFDAIACHVAGVKNAVATLGTALTPAHLRLLRRFSKNVLLVFDSDAAGIKAAERSLDIFLGTDMTPKVALLPTGDDPDSLVRRDGPAALAERLKASERLVEFVIRRTASGAKSLEEKVAAAAALVEMLAKMENSVERGHYLKKSADALGVEEDALAEELAKKLGRKAGGKGVFKSAGKAAFQGLNKIEEGLLHIILHHPETALEVMAGITPADFTDGRLKRLAERMFGLIDEDGAISVPKLIDSLADEEEKKFVMSLCAREIIEDPAGFARGAIDRMTEAGRRRRGDELARLIREAEEKGDTDLLNKLQKEYAGWQKRKS